MYRKEIQAQGNFDKLVEYFTQFPGIGTRQAKRFAFYLVSKDEHYIEELTQTIHDVKKETKQCILCMRYHSEKDTICHICSNQSRNSSFLLLIEKDQDIESFENAHVYDGIYFVLGKLISVASREEVRVARVNRLIERIKKLLENNTKLEIICAFPTTPNGLFTDSFIKQELEKLFPSISIKSLGRGFATGSDPEYADSDTLSFALKNRV